MTTLVESEPSNNEVVVTMTNDDGNDDTPTTTNTTTKWEEYLLNNRRQLPYVMKEHLQWVYEKTNQFDDEKLLEWPPTMQQIKDRLTKGRSSIAQKQKQQAGTNTTKEQFVSTKEIFLRKPTVLPVKNPLREDEMKEILFYNQDDANTNNANGIVMTEEQLERLCEAVQGYHPGAMKGPLENWLFDSFLSSAEQIIPNLFLGGVSTAHNKIKLVDTLKIKNVLCVGGTALAFGETKYEPPFPNDVAYKVIDVDDTEKTADADALGNCFPDAVSFIEACLVNKKERILVHCMAGASRSTSVICSYLIWKFHIAVDDALMLVRSARPIATPNAAFVEQLEKWYDKQVVQ
jgi:protein-tyrosine phosphatase